MQMNDKSHPVLKKISEIYLRFAPEAVKDEFSPNHWKEKVLYLFVLVTVIAGFFMLVLGMPGNIEKEYWMICLAAAIGYPGCLFVFAFPGMRFEARAVIACTLIYLLGIALILDMNPFMASREYLFSFSIIASILLGWWGAIISIAINLITWIAVGELIDYGFWPQLAPLEDAWLNWHLVAIDLVFINISTIILITMFFSRINKSDQAAKNYSQLLLKESHKLTETNRRLETEIEDRKTITQALRESEEKYRTILESIEDVYFEVDLKGNLTFFNNAMKERLEFPGDQLVGMNYRDLTDEANAEKLLFIFRQVYATGKASPPVDIEIISGNGKLITTGILVSLKNDKTGTPIGFQGLARDITEYKAMENQLHQAQKMEAVGTLAGGVAHDLNNILSGVVSYPELLLMELDNDHPMRKPIQTIKSSGEKAVAIVQDLLTLARRSVAVKDVVNLNAVVLEYMESTEFRTLKSFYPEVQIETDLDRSLFNMIGSPVHLSKTIMNLISNAVEAIRDTGKVTISTRNRYFEAGTHSGVVVGEGDYIMLTIRDTGDGIAPDDMDKIFEPFFTKKVMGRSGTGLGMAVVWGTVKDHGGHIDVQSIPGQGTTFNIVFPATRQSTTVETGIQSLDRFKGNGEHILIVDDVETQREIATAMLTKLGYTADSVDSGEKALAYVKTRSTDLLVLDMIMRPGMDGLETYQQILEIHPGQKAIIASGFSETEQVRQAQKLGAGQYIRKPYSLEALGSAVAAALKKQS